MHLKKVNLHPDKYPTRKHYPFNLDLFSVTKSLSFNSPVTFFVGENGSGKSLMSQSHGQSLMAFFTSRFKIKGIYFLDEPETALSPKSQLELLNLLEEMGRSGQAQFIIATRSPILLACPGSEILSFDENPVKQIDYEDTNHFRIYKEFMADPKKFLLKN